MTRRARPSDNGSLSTRATNATLPAPAAVPALRGHDHYQPALVEGMMEGGPNDEALDAADMDEGQVRRRCRLWLWRGPHAVPPAWCPPDPRT